MLTSSITNATKQDATAAGLVYEAPLVEMVLSPAEVDRQVQYAGVIISCNGGPCAPPPQE